MYFMFSKAIFLMDFYFTVASHGLLGGKSQRFLNAKYSEHTFLYHLTEADRLIKQSKSIKVMICFLRGGMVSLLHYHHLLNVFNVT